MSKNQNHHLDDAPQIPANQKNQTSNDPREVSLALSSLFDVAKLGFQRFVEGGGLGSTPGDHDRSALSLGQLRLSPSRHEELMATIRDLIDSFASDVDDDASADDSDETRLTLFVAAYEEQS